MAKQSAYFTLGEADGKRDAAALKQGLDQVPGVLSVSVTPDKGSVAVDFDDTGTGMQQLAGRIQKMGYKVYEVDTKRHNM